jgi:iron complex transport system substrate-binding protein
MKAQFGRALPGNLAECVISSEARNLLMLGRCRISPLGRNDRSCIKLPFAIALFVVVTFLSVIRTPAVLCATFKDALDREVVIHEAPGRIIPLAPSLTEILYHLGLGDKVVGVTNHCNYPPDAAAKPKVGSYINLNVEQIVSLAPDLVIGTVDGNERAVVEILEKAGIPIYLVNPRNVREAILTMALLGEICGVEQAAKALAAELTGRVDQVVLMTASREKPLVFLQINLQPIMTVNSRTMHHDLIRLAGGRNMTAEEPITYPRISMEEIIRRQPDIILISSMQRGGRFEKAKEEWLKWASIPAVKTGRVHLIDSDLIDRPSPRVVEGLQIMAKLIHPGIAWR